MSERLPTQQLRPTALQAHFELLQRISANRTHGPSLRVAARPACSHPHDDSERIKANRGKFPQFSVVPIAIFGMVFWGGVILWLLHINN